jgi:hypothetical protein
MVAHALKGESLVPVARLEVTNIHSFGGCVVLEDAARRYKLDELLVPLAPRNASLIRAMIFGGLLTAPSVAPFYLEARTARLAMYCGLDPDKERFDTADLAAALHDLDEHWTQVRALLLGIPHADIRAIAVFTTSRTGKTIDLGAIGMDGDGIPIPLLQEEALNNGPGPAGVLQQIAQTSKPPQPLLALDEETAARISVERLEKQPYIIDLAPESLAALLRQLNIAQLHEALRTRGPIEVRHRGRRHVLIPAAAPGEIEAQGSPLKMGSLKELASIAPAKSADLPASARNPLAPGAFHGIATNIPAERLMAASAAQWALRAQAARAAFAPVQIVIGRPPSGEGVLTWRNHRNLQFLTHRLRCHLHTEWSALCETRPVEDVLRDLQEVHRATLTVNGEVVRRLASHPSKAVIATLDRLNLWPLFESPDCGRK